MIIISSTEKSLRFDVKNIDMCVGTVLSPILPSTDMVRSTYTLLITSQVICTKIYSTNLFRPLKLISGASGSLLLPLLHFILPFQQDFHCSTDLMLRKACFILQIQGEISGS